MRTGCGQLWLDSEDMLLMVLQRLMLAVVQRVAGSVIAGVLKLFIALLISALSPYLFMDNK